MSYRTNHKTRTKFVVNMQGKDFTEKQRDMIERINALDREIPQLQAGIRDSISQMDTDYFAGSLRNALREKAMLLEELKK